MKVLLALFSLEVHSIGLHAVARAMEAAGHEVIVLGACSPAGIAAAAIEEDADAVGVSCHCGGEIEQGSLLMAHMLLLAERMPLMLIGGLIAPGHAAQLAAMGYRVFGPDDSLDQLQVALTDSAAA